MKSLFSVSFVLFSILLNRRALCSVLDCKDIYSTSALVRLKEYLFCYYDAEIRPTDNYKNATVVRVGLMIQEFEVVELSSTVDFGVWAKMTWTDPHLTWVPSQFDGIESIGVMSYEIWTPDIVMHSPTNMGADVDMPTVQCWLHYRGTVLCVPTTVYTPVCETDHTWWPYDSMRCALQIAPWAHSNDEVELKLTEFGAEGQLLEDAYDKNSQWQIAEISETASLMNSKFSVLNYIVRSSVLSFHIVLKRHSAMYSTIYVSLAIVLMAMTLMVLWLEPRSTERIIIANLNFVFNLLCLLDLHWKLPFNGPRSPELIFFYANSLVLATFSLILTSILRHVQELNTEPPIWISWITVSILQSRVGQIFLVSILDPKVSARIEMNADDNTNLVSLDKQESTWRYTSILIGWLAFLSVSVVYVVMLIVSLPTSRHSNSVSFLLDT